MTPGTPRTPRTPRTPPGSAKARSGLRPSTRVAPRPAAAPAVPAAPASKPAAKAPMTRAQLGNALRTVVEASIDPAMAAADWLARDIDPSRSTAIALLTDPGTPVEALRKAKDVYKTMRILGEHSADRRLAARLYVAAIASAMVYHDERISRQSVAAIKRGLQSLVDDGAQPEPLRKLAGSALSYLMHNAA